MLLRTALRAGALTFAAALFISACIQQQPASDHFVAAVEVPLRTAADRADLLGMLQRHARDGGLHVDDVSEGQSQFARGVHLESPEANSMINKTIYVGVWRGAEDDDLEVLVDDGGHQGRPWLMFLRGKHPDLATKMRVGLLAEIDRRWPEARDVPVFPNGSVPGASDLVWTGKAYVVSPTRAPAYGK